MITIAAAGGVLSVTGGYAYADVGADGGARNSPGMASGNNVQTVVNTPVNVCGTTVTLVGELNKIAGTKCANNSGSSGKHGEHDSSGGGPSAHGGTSNSPGVGSGNNVQTVVNTPVNVCGTTVNGITGVGNEVLGSDCANNSSKPQHHEHPWHPEKPGKPGEDKPEKPSEPAKHHPQTVTTGEEQLAETGSSDLLGVALPTSAAMMLGGVLLYRRARAASRS